MKLDTENNCTLYEAYKKVETKAKEIKAYVYEVR